MANPTDHYLLTGLDVHSTIWKTVADAAALAALTPAAEDIGKDVLQADDSSVHKLVETGPAVWKNITAAAAASDHGSLAGLTPDDDHPQYGQVINGAGAPGASTGNGYRLGTGYVDTTGDNAYTLADATTDANVWSSGISKQIWPVRVAGAWLANSTANLWVGHGNYSPWQTSVQATGRGSASLPSIPAYSIDSVMPYDGVITLVKGWYHVSGAADEGDFAFVKTEWTDASSTSTESLIGSLIAIPSGQTTGLRYDLSTTFSSSNTVSAGDTIGLYYRNTGTGTNNIYVDLTYIVEFDDGQV